MLTGHRRAEVLDVLERGRRLGLLGPGPVDRHLDHSQAFLAAWSSLVGKDAPERMLDLGSGGGVPGLVLATARTDTAVVLLDGSTKRAAFLSEAVTILGLADRVEVVAQRAEEAARGLLRASLDLVTARSFSSAAATAECAAGFLVPEAWLLVAEPPTFRTTRWPATDLGRIGLRPAGRLEDPFHIQVLRRHGTLPEQVPRRVGVPARRPLWADV